MRRNAALCASLLTALASSGCACSGAELQPDAAAPLDAAAPDGAVSRDTGSVDAPVSDAPVSDAPASDAPGSDALVSDASSADARLPLTACEGLGTFEGDLPCVDTGCRLIETLEIDPPHARNDRPSIAVDGSGAPVVAYTIAEGGYRAFLARRDATGFVSTPAGVAAIVAIAMGRDGCGYGFLNDGAYGASIHRIEGSTFVPVEAHDALMVTGPGLLLDASGALHFVAYEERAGGGVRGRFDGTYEEHPLAGTAGRFFLPASLALRADGTVELAYYANLAAGHGLYHQVGDAAPELVATASGDPTLFGPSAALAIGGDGSTHLLHATHRGDVVLATRAATWALDPLFAGEVSDPCPETDVEGASCTTRDVRWSVLGLVAAADGDALGLVSRTQIDVVSKVECSGGPFPLPPGPPPPFCTYVEQSRSTQTALHAVSIAGTDVTTLELAREGGGLVGTLALAPDGTVHVAAYDASGAVRYTAVGAE